MEDPGKSDHPAVSALYAVVSDPENGMAQVQKKMTESARKKLPGGMDPRVQELLQNPELRELQKKFN